MNWHEGFAGLQLVAEEEIGTALRAKSRDEDASEDASLAALRQEQLEKL